MAMLISTKKRRIAYLRKEMYVTVPVNYLRITADELLESAARNTGINKGTIYSGVNSIVNEFRNYLLKGHPVQIPELGTFRMAFSAHASETPDETGAQAVYRRRILFTPCVSLKNALNSVQLSPLQADILTIADDTTSPETSGGGENGGGTNEGGGGTDNGGSTNGGGTSPDPSEGGENSDPDPENPGGGDNGGGDSGGGDGGSGDDEN